MMNKRNCLQDREGAPWHLISLTVFNKVKVMLTVTAKQISQRPLDKKQQSGCIALYTYANRKSWFAKHTYLGGTL
jgi:hypothetical protein